MKKNEEDDKLATLFPLGASGVFLQQLNIFTAAATSSYTFLLLLD